MIDYCTDQWMILQYPAGAGGKFVGNCLFLFDKIAHWHGIKDQYTTVEYFKKNLLNQDPLWTNRELNHRWNINFFSRCYTRNNDLRCVEFNQLVKEQASFYFQQCWNQQYTIVDCWHKPSLPDFWQKANSVTIVLDNLEIYKNLMFSKLYKIDKHKNKIISILDSPQVATEENKKNVEMFNNPYEFDLIDLDDFFETNVKQKPWLLPWFDKPLGADQFTIGISELVDCRTFIYKFQWFEDLYKQKIPTKYLEQMHNIWSIANERQQKQFSYS